MRRGFQDSILVRGASGFGQSLDGSCAQRPNAVVAGSHRADDDDRDAKGRARIPDDPRLDDAFPIGLEAGVTS